MKFATINDAIDFYKRLASENPENSVIMNTLGDLYIKAGDRARAYTYYKQAMDILEKNTNYQNAIAIGKKILRYVGKNPEILLRISKLYTKIGDYREAIKYALLIDPRGIDLDLAEEVTGLINFLVSNTENPDIKLRLTQISDAIVERLQTEHFSEDFDLLGQPEEEDEMPPLLEDIPIKVGEDTIIDLSVPEEKVEKKPRKVDPEFLEAVLKRVSRNEYQTNEDYLYQIKALMDGNFYNEALWLLQNLAPERRKEIPFEKYILICLVETNQVDELREFLGNIKENTDDPEVLYYLARAYEKLNEQSTSLKIYYLLKTLYGNYRDVSSRIKKLRSG